MVARAAARRRPEPNLAAQVEAGRLQIWAQVITARREQFSFDRDQWHQAVDAEFQVGSFSWKRIGCTALQAVYETESWCWLDHTWRQWSEYAWGQDHRREMAESETKAKHERRTAHRSRPRPIRTRHRGARSRRPRVRRSSRAHSPPGDSDSSDPDPDPDPDPALARHRRAPSRAPPGRRRCVAVSAPACQPPEGERAAVTDRHPHEAGAESGGTC